MEDLDLIYNMKKNPEEIEVKKKKKKKLKNETNENLKNVSIPKGIDIDTIDL